WISPERIALICGLIEARVPQWRNGARKFQLESWARTLAGSSQLLVVPTGGGKTAVFYGVLLVLEELAKNPVVGIGPVPKTPVAMVVTPLNELGIMQVSSLIT
ncbi:hypothetical protein BJ138DRAFT_979926, partial [Hygrophoropsis aurantiaca]